MSIRASATYVEAKLELERLGKWNIVFLLRWVGRTAKAIGLRHIANATEQKRLMTWVQLQKLNGAKHVTLELTYLGRRYLLVKSPYSNGS